MDGRRTMIVDFMTDNDITGGNSGSPVLNAKGELIGLEMCIRDSPLHIPSFRHVLEGGAFRTSKALSLHKRLKLH